MQIDWRGASTNEDNQDGCQGLARRGRFLGLSDDDLDSSDGHVGDDLDFHVEMAEIPEKSLNGDGATSRQRDVVVGKAN